MMGFLGGVGNDLVQLMTAGTNFLLCFVRASDRTVLTGFFWSSFFFLGGHDFILRRHRMIPISGRKDFRFASTFSSFSRW
jgi:hypothetical protein